MPLSQDVWRLMRAGPNHVVRVSGPCDFVMFWAVGRMAASGHAAEVFTLDQTFAAEASNPAANGLRLPWFYPPPGLLLPASVQKLPFFTAFFVWEACIILFVCAILRLCDLPWPVILVSLLSPAALLNDDLGQLGFLTASLLIGGILLADQKPGWAGGLFGMLVFKPQAGLLAPVVFWARGKWTGLAAGAIVTASLCGLTLALFGFALWRNYFTQALPLSRFMLDLPFPSHPPPITSSYEFYGISVLWMMRSLGAGLWLSEAVQLLAAIGAVGLCFMVWRRANADPIARLAVTLCLALLATPYGYVYDLCGVSLAFAALAYRERRLVLTDALLWTWPVTGLIISQHFYLELAPLMLAAAGWRASQAL